MGVPHFSGVPCGCRGGTHGTPIYMLGSAEWAASPSTWRGSSHTPLGTFWGPQTFERLKASLGAAP